MFTPERRDEVRERLLELAREDPEIAGAAITGSYAIGASDEWSDIDVAFGVRGELAPTIERWTARLYDELGQVDIAFIPQGALAAAADALALELELTDANLAARLRPTLEAARGFP